MNDFVGDTDTERVSDQEAAMIQREIRTQKRIEELEHLGDAMAEAIEDEDVCVFANGGLRQLARAWRAARKETADEIR